MALQRRSCHQLRACNVDWLETFVMELLEET